MYIIKIIKIKIGTKFIREYGTKKVKKIVL